MMSRSCAPRHLPVPGPAAEVASADIRPHPRVNARGSRPGNGRLQRPRCGVPAIPARQTRTSLSLFPAPRPPACVEFTEFLRLTESERAAPTPVLLQVVVQSPVESAAGPGVVDDIQRSPDPPREPIDDMPLKLVERILSARVCAIELGIVRVQRDRGLGLQRPLTERLGDADLGLEGPAVRAEVHRAVGCLAPGWSCRLMPTTNLTVFRKPGASAPGKKQVDRQPESGRRSHRRHEDRLTGVNGRT